MERNINKHESSNPDIDKLKDEVLLAIEGAYENGFSVILNEIINDQLDQDEYNSFSKMKPDLIRPGVFAETERAMPVNAFVAEQDAVLRGIRGTVPYQRQLSEGDLVLLDASNERDNWFALYPTEGEEPVKITKYESDGMEYSTHVYFQQATSMGAVGRRMMNDLERSKAEAAARRFKRWSAIRRLGGKSLIG
jgi:hypothetical protein